jgi:two-component system nitrate/nitrite response regulator NarL
MTPTTLIRILLVDDHTLFRESVARLLTAEPDFVVVGDCAGSAECLRLLTRTPADVLLLDYDLGQENGTELLRQLRANGFLGKVLVVTAGVTPREASELIRCGVNGIFFKHESPISLCQSIRDVAGGRVCFEQDLLDQAVRKMASESGHPQSKELTERERQVISFVLDGLTNKEIADRLSVSETAVKGTLQQLFKKGGVRTRSQLVRIALEQYRDAL